MNQNDEMYFKIKKAIQTGTLMQLKFSQQDLTDLEVEGRRLHASDATNEAINHAKEQAWKNEVSQV